MQRQGQDIADRLGSLVQGLGCMWQTHLRSSGGSSVEQPAGGQQAPLPTFPLLDVQCPDQKSSSWQWSWPAKPHPKAGVPFNRVHFHGRRTPTATDTANQGSPGLHELAQRLSQVGADIGASIGSFASHLSKQFSLAFREEPASQVTHSSSGITLEYQGDYVDERDTGTISISASNGKLTTWKRAGNMKQRKTEEPRHLQEDCDCTAFSNEELFALFTKRQSQLHRQGSINVTTTYDSRTQEVESSVTARGDLWRAEASHGGSRMTNGPSPLFLLQIGPILFVRDTTLLLPIHLSKQHLLWYGFDRKNGVHSICPAMWSKHRRWLLMSMICLSPVTCSFVDLQFPNGQFTYVAGEGVSGSVFYPLLGGLLQAQTHRPGTTKLSFSKKMLWKTRLTPSFQIPEKSVSLDIVQPVAWQRSGIMVRPTVQLRVAPTIGGRNAGWRAEIAHSPKERISWACGCTFTIQPTAYASISVGKSKREGNGSGSSGLVLVVETPVETPVRASFCIQLNSGVEF
ncbi:hypothetical protein GOP47_0001925 [Adiantum capillus-veneris]|uniref:Uncharacterized protein n=1 Tax=Adiantum capillus-veneris TaxID=13818 RepID=A0A9D4VB14_ADICA|nr:hypothetical protein GOP47_0001925 [Adiantum capillus-veneris]